MHSESNCQQKREKRHESQLKRTKETCQVKEKAWERKVNMTEQLSLDITRLANIVRLPVCAHRRESGLILPKQKWTDFLAQELLTHRRSRFGY